MMKKIFPKIDFEDTKFVPNLKRIPQDIQDNIAAYVVDAYAQYNEWYKMLKQLSKTTRRLWVELTNSQEMEAQSERLISEL